MGRVPNPFREWCPSTQVHPSSVQNAAINKYGGCVTCGHWGPVTRAGTLRRHKRVVSESDAVTKYANKLDKELSEAAPTNVTLAGLGSGVRLLEILAFMQDGSVRSMGKFAPSILPRAQGGEITFKVKIT